jgi:hypothetical protein
MAISKTRKPKKTEDWKKVQRLIEQLERDLNRLKRAVPKSSRAPRAKPTTRKKAKSLYGMFPPSDTTWEDFRMARASWSRRLDDL